VGAVTRDSKSQVLISACRNLAACDSVEEDETRLAIIGLESLAKIYKGPVVLEMDCSGDCERINAGRQNQIGLLWPDSR
jgi:hypothetical protein